MLALPNKGHGLPPPALSFPSQPPACPVLPETSLTSTAGHLLLPWGSIFSPTSPHIPGTEQTGGWGREHSVPVTSPMGFASCKAKEQGVAASMGTLLSLNSLSIPFSPHKAEVPRCTWEKERGTTRLLQEAHRHPHPASHHWEGHEHCSECKQWSAQQPWPHSPSPPLSYHYNLHRKKKSGLFKQCLNDSLPQRIKLPFIACSSN